MQQKLQHHIADDILAICLALHILELNTESAGKHLLVIPP